MRSAPRKASRKRRIDRVLQVKGKRTVREFHRAIGAICWDKVGMARNEAGLQSAIARDPRSCAMSSGRTSTCRARPTT